MNKRKGNVYAIRLYVAGRTNSECGSKNGDGNTKTSLG